MSQQLIISISVSESMMTTNTHFEFSSSPAKANSQVSTESEDSLTQPKDLSSDSRKAKLKRSLCRNFQELGNCPYGSKCRFAHGVEELRCNNNGNSTYKTKQCQAFLKQGYCMYGQCCNFRHLTEAPSILPLIDFRDEGSKLLRLIGV